MTIVFRDASKSCICVYIAAGTQIVESQSLLRGSVFSLIFNALIPSFPLKEDFSLQSGSIILIQSKDLELFFHKLIKIESRKGKVKKRRK